MKFQATIVSRKQKWEGQIDSLTLPSQDGQLTLLANHAPIIGTLGKGHLRVGSSEFRIDQGFFEFKDNQAVVVVEEETVHVAGDEKR